MNKTIIYKDEDALVLDENDNQDMVSNTDNLLEILETENFIELLEKTIKEYEEEYGSEKKESKLSKLYYLAPVLIANLVAIFGVLGIGKYFGVDDTLVDTIFGEMTKKGLLLTSMVPGLTFMGGLLSLMEYNSYIGFKKNRNGERAKAEAAKKELEVQKEKLDELKKDKTLSPENSKCFTKKDINNKKINSIVTNFLDFYYTVGYNEEKYLRYYEKGILEKKLEKSFSDDTIECVKEYLDENASVLEKNRKRKNK